MTVSAKVAAAKSGVTPQSFAEEVLTRLGITPTKTNVSNFVAWEKAEGGNWNNTAAYNPLNTTLKLPGSGATGTQGNIGVYTSWQQGVEATVETLQNGDYGNILQALQKSQGWVSFASAVDRSSWGTKLTVEGGIEQEAGLAGIVQGKIPGFSKEGGVEESAEHGAEDAASFLSGGLWGDLGELGLKLILLLAGAFLVVYGIMVAVRPRDRALSLPTPKAVPVPV